MENDFYLHNFHTSGLVSDSVGRYGRMTSMKTYERAFGIDWREDEEIADGDMEPHSMAFPDESRRQPASSSTGNQQPSNSWERESKRVMRVRSRCKEQHAALSVWWKVALQANLKERLWVRLGQRQDETLLPGRFDRVYQPEKLSQFDRFFSRTWETPVRRTHAAQHSEGINDDGTAVTYSRVISADFTTVSPSVRNGQPHSSFLGEMKVSELVRDYGFAPREESSMKLFSDHFHKAHGGNQFEYITRSDASRMQSVPQEYLKYCATAQQTFEPYNQNRVEEFQRELHDYTLSSDNVSGIRQVSRKHSVSMFAIYPHSHPSSSCFSACAFCPRRGNNFSWGI